MNRTLVSLPMPPDNQSCGLRPLVPPLAGSERLRTFAIAALGLLSALRELRKRHLSRTGLGTRQCHIPTGSGVGTVLICTSLTVALAADAVTATPKTCQIAQSIYRDADGNGYELIFGPPAPPIYHGRAVIKHPQHGQLYRFLISQASGYGTIRLIDQDTKKTSELTITFFDQQLKSATPLFWGDEPVAPQYATIANLGRHDHYTYRDALVHQPNLNRPTIGDVIWIFDRCQ